MSSERPREESAARYAEALRERFETKGTLRELQEYPNFVVWRYVSVDRRLDYLSFAQINDNA